MLTPSNLAPFVLTINAQSGLFYTVIHKVTTLCGEGCSANEHYYVRGENNAKDASYTADIKNGCELIDEVFSDCVAPIKLTYDCRRSTLNWSNVPSANRYVVQVNWDDPTCCRGGGSNPTSNQWNVSGNSFQLPYINQSGCFSWRVGSRCSKGIVWSETVCSTCITKPGDDGPTKPNDTASDVKTSAKISPNPNDGNMNIEISGNDKTTFTLKVYRFDGTLIKTFNENRIENQSIKISWNGKTVLTEGMYFFVITTDKETITKKVIIE